VYGPRRHHTTDVNEPVARHRRVRTNGAVEQ
jgi:hypothetical protein